MISLLTFLNKGRVVQELTRVAEAEWAADTERQRLWLEEQQRKADEAARREREYREARELAAKADMEDAEMLARDAELAGIFCVHLFISNHLEAFCTLKFWSCLKVVSLFIFITFAIFCSLSNIHFFFFFFFFFFFYLIIFYFRAL